MKYVEPTGRIINLIPQGTTRGHKLILRGAAMSKEDATYIGWWGIDTMPRHVSQELMRELRANWNPGFQRADDW